MISSSSSFHLFLTVDYSWSSEHRIKEERQRMAKMSGELAKLKITSLQRESSNEFHEEEEFNMFLKHRKERANDQQHPPSSIDPETIVRHNIGTQNTSCTKE